MSQSDRGIAVSTVGDHRAAHNGQAHHLVNIMRIFNSRGRGERRRLIDGLDDGDYNDYDNDDDDNLCRREDKDIQQE